MKQFYQLVIAMLFALAALSITANLFMAKIINNYAEEVESLHRIISEKNV